MSVEVLSEGQPWDIPLPREDDTLLDRHLEALDDTGTVRARWEYRGTQMSEGWVCIVGADPGPTAPNIGVVCGLHDLFEEIVEGCMKYGWTLRSVPRDRSTAQGPSGTS